MSNLQSSAVSEHVSEHDIAERKAAKWSPRTVKAYRAHLAIYTAWAAEHGAPTVDPDGGPIGSLSAPVPPATVAEYLTSRDKAGKKAATIKMDAAAIGALHRDQLLANPVEDAEVKETLRGIARGHAREGQRQATPLTVEIIERMEASGADVRDVTLAWLLLDGALRIGEAAALRWEDVSYEADGSGRITIRSSKTDAFGEGAVVAVSSRAADALRDLWDGEPEDAYVFRNRRSTRGDADWYAPLQKDNLRVRLARAGQRIGVQLSGHSGRVGFAQRLAQRGAPLHVVMALGRWKRAETVARYIRKLDAAEVLRYLD